jgi:hypothetical protein
VSKRSHLLLSILSATALAFGLAGCAGEVPMEPAEGANDPACAELIVRLPSSVSGLDKRATNAQATGAWGDPVGVELRCGIEPSGPTTDRCVHVVGVDWIIDESNAPLYRFEPYGRSPGVEVFVNSEIASGTLTVTDLAASIKVLPQTRECVGAVDFADPEQAFEQDESTQTEEPAEAAEPSESPE